MKNNELIVCSAPKKSEHCLTKCFCGKPHQKDSGRDACHKKVEVCTLSNGGIIKVVCKPVKIQRIIYAKIHTNPEL